MALRPGPPPILPPTTPTQILYEGPAVPVTYDPNWKTYVNLTPAQIAAFEAFPQDLMSYADNQRWIMQSNGTLPTGQDPAAMLTFVTALYEMQIAVNAQVNAAVPTITARAQIDTLLATVTPVVALAPSPT